MLNAAERPLAFKHLQTADLSDWRPGNSHAEFDRLLKLVTEVAPLTKGGKLLADLHTQFAEYDRLAKDSRAVLPLWLDHKAQPLVPSPALAAIVGASPITHRLAVDKVLVFIKSIPPNEPNKAELIIRGATLRALFGETQTVTIPDVVKAVSDNLV
jgi:hypothetical protein